MRARTHTLAGIPAYEGACTRTSARICLHVYVHMLCGLGGGVQLLSPRPALHVESSPLFSLQTARLAPSSLCLPGRQKLREFSGWQCREQERERERARARDITGPSRNREQKAPPQLKRETPNLNLKVETASPMKARSPTPQRFLSPM